MCFIENLTIAKIHKISYPRPALDIYNSKMINLPRIRQILVAKNRSHRVQVRNGEKTQTWAKQVGQSIKRKQQKMKKKKKKKGRSWRKGKKIRGGGGRRCVWVQRRGCRVTNEILVPFCLQYCRGCIHGVRRSVGQKVGHFHGSLSSSSGLEHLVPGCGEREGNKEQEKRKTEKPIRQYTRIQRGPP